MSTQSPAWELARAVTTALLADGMLTDPNTGLLFPAYSPQVDPLDVRVYTANAELPEIPALRDTIPRVMVAAFGTPHAFEQDNIATLQAVVGLDIHCVVRKEYEQAGDAIATRVATVVLSTQASSARIIAAGLVQDGDWHRGRLEAFGGAWDYVSRFRCANVGVLV